MIQLKKGREKSLKRRHPWIFSGAVERVIGKPGSGDTVEVRDASGQVLAQAAFSPKSQIRARVWSFDPAEPLGIDFFRNRLTRAVALREGLPAARHTNAMRLVHGESDGMPGLVVDRYADVLVVQFLAAGVERWREPILDALVELTGCEALFERSDAEVRTLEGLEHRVGFARGNRAASRCPSTASTSASTSSRARRPDSFSTSGKTASACVRSPQAAKCWTDSAIPAASPSPRWPALRSA
jgi:23S rRNA (cytosine1962-C5)-methyltransferase